MVTIRKGVGPARHLAPGASLGRVATGALLVTGLATTMVLGTYWTASGLQAGLLDAARSTLDAGGLHATVLMSGRDAYVWARTPTERADAIAALRMVPGVRVVLVGPGEPPSYGAVVSTSAQADPVALVSNPGSPPGPTPPSPTSAATARPGVSAPAVRTSTTHKPSTMTKEG